MRAIDADKLKVRLETYEYVNASKSAERGGNEVLHYFMSKIIDDEPTLDYAPVKRGHWEINCDGYYPYCTNCGNEPQVKELTKFCPKCGAMMLNHRVDKQ